MKFSGVRNIFLIKYSYLKFYFHSEEYIPLKHKYNHIYPFIDYGRTHHEEIPFIFEILKWNLLYWKKITTTRRKCARVMELMRRNADNVVTKNKYVLSAQDHTLVATLQDSASISGAGCFVQNPWSWLKKTWKCMESSKKSHEGSRRQQFHSDLCLGQAETIELRVRQRNTIYCNKWWMEGREFCWSNWWWKTAKMHAFTDSIAISWAFDCSTVIYINASSTNIRIHKQGDEWQLHPQHSYASVHLSPQKCVTSSWTPLRNRSLTPLPPTANCKAVKHSLEIYENLFGKLETLTLGKATFLCGGQVMQVCAVYVFSTQLNVLLYVCVCMESTHDLLFNGTFSADNTTTKNIAKKVLKSEVIGIFQIVKGHAFNFCMHFTFRPPLYCDGGQNV